MHRPSDSGTWKRTLSLLAAGLVLAACGEAPPPGGGSGTSGLGSISGTLHAGGTLGASNDEKPAAADAYGDRNVEPVPAAPDAEPRSEAFEAPHMTTGEPAHRLGGLAFVEGELIVAFDRTVTPAEVRTLEVSGVPLTSVRSLTVEGAQLYRAAGANAGDLARVIAELEARPDVRYAQPNYLLQPLQATVEPNDPIYTDPTSDVLWHYATIGMPRAWGVTTGASQTVVAVVDSGILVSGSGTRPSHADMAGRMVAGYDFISDPMTAVDGDGRDADPYDEGDEPFGQGTYHGTHVAGTVGASANDGFGVPGVDWSARIQPIRVLGVGGGSMSDIIEGTLWAAGFSVPGVPVNTTPAHVINLSLGGSSACTAYEQEAFDLIAASSPNDAIVVVAAGNNNEDAWNFTPASCRNVITVGASDYADRRSPYSNYGTRIDVMAPGGDITADANGDGFSDGVLSTWGQVQPDGGVEPAWQLKEGTSMAAPHVAGVIALMKSLNPSLSGADALGMLSATAVPLSATECGRASASDCGAGRIDAGAVLTLMQGGTGGGGPTPTPGGEPLVFDPDPLDFGDDLTQANVALHNTTSASLSWSVLYYEPVASNPGSLEQGFLSVPAGGTLAAGASETLTVMLDRSFVSSDGSYKADLVFDVGGSETALTIQLAKRSGNSSGPSGPTLVAAFLPDASAPDGFVASGSALSPSFGPTYEIEVLAGENLVIAWIDETRDGTVNDGDFIGVHPFAVQVAPQSARTGVNVILERSIDLEVTGSSASLAEWFTRDDTRSLLRQLGAID